MAVNKHLENMAATFLQYRTDPTLCDAVILVDDGELNAHSVILSAVSPVFLAAMTVPNVPHCIRVSNATANEMRLVLDTIYSGRIHSDTSNRFSVTQLLRRLQVDISRLEVDESEESCGVDMSFEQLVKSEIDSHFPTDDESTIDFDMNIEESQNSCDTPPISEILVHQSTDLASTSTKEMGGMPVSEFCGCTHKCNSVIERGQLACLKSMIQGLCYPRLCILVAAFTEICNTVKRKTAHGSGGRMRTCSVKYWIPISESSLERIQVCQKMFREVFGIHDHEKIRNIVQKIRKKESLVDQRGRCGKSNKSTGSSESFLKLENDHLSSSTQQRSLSTLLASSCDCRQCKGSFQCDYCGHKSWTEQTHRKHVWKLCRKAKEFHEKQSAEQYHKQLGQSSAIGFSSEGGASAADCSGCKKYKCVYCDLTFETHKEKAEHTTHEHFRHTASKEFPCDMCDKLLSTATGLKKHRDWHKEQTLHLCQICGKYLKSKITLVKHVARYHDTNSVSKFKCNLCPEVFVRQLMYIKHREKVHGIYDHNIKILSLYCPRMSLSCDKCSKLVGSLGALRTHKKKYCHGKKESDRSNVISDQ